MNRYTRWLILRLIDFKLRRIKKRATKKAMKADYKTIRTTAFADFIEDRQEFVDLMYTRDNIANINNPWQGIFAYHWTLYPKNTKHIEKFEPFVPDERPVVAIEEMIPRDREFAVLSDEDFINALNEERFEKSVE